MHGLADLEFLGPLDQSFPRIGREQMKERCLHLGVATPSGKAGRDDFGIVEQHHIARPQQVRQIAHRAIHHRCACHIQQPRRITRTGWAVGDEIARQVKIEVVNPHWGIPKRRLRSTVRKRCAFLHRNRLERQEGTHIKGLYETLSKPLKPHSLFRLFLTIIISFASCEKKA